MVADALRRELLRRAGAELVEDAGGADWVVGGRVLPLEIAPASFSPVRARARVPAARSRSSLRAARRDGREMTGDPRALRESERYLASADAEAQRKNRDEALRRVSRLLAARFHDRLDEEHGGEPGRARARARRARRRGAPICSRARRRCCATTRSRRCAPPCWATPSPRSTLDRFDGGVAPGELVDALRTLPVIAPRRLVVLREPEARRGSARALLDAVARLG